MPYHAVLCLADVNKDCQIGLNIDLTLKTNATVRHRSSSFVTPAFFSAHRPSLWRPYVGTLEDISSLSGLGERRLDHLKKPVFSEVRWHKVPH